MESAQHLSAGRVLIIGSPTLLAEQQAYLAKLSGKVHDLAIYASEGYDTHQSLLARALVLAAIEGISFHAALQDIPIARELEGFGIGL